MKDDARTIYNSVEIRICQIVDILKTDFDQLNNSLDLKQRQADSREARAANTSAIVLRNLASQSAKQGSVRKTSSNTVKLMEHTLNFIGHARIYNGHYHLRKCLGQLILSSYGYDAHEFL